MPFPPLGPVGHCNRDISLIKRDPSGVFETHTLKHLEERGVLNECRRRHVAAGGPCLARAACFNFQPSFLSTFPSSLMPN